MLHRSGASDHPAQAQELLRERSLAGVDVGDDAQIATGGRDGDGHGLLRPSHRSSQRVPPLDRVRRHGKKRRPQIVPNHFGRRKGPGPGPADVEHVLHARVENKVRWRCFRFAATGAVHAVKARAVRLEHVSEERGLPPGLAALLPRLIRSAHYLFPALILFGDC